MSQAEIPRPRNGMLGAPFSSHVGIFQEGPPMKKRNSTIAMPWQLEILRCLFEQTQHPTEEQKKWAASKTGLEEKWIMNWFQRQRNPKKRSLACIPSPESSGSSAGHQPLRSIPLPDDGALQPTESQFRPRSESHRRPSQAHASGIDVPADLHDHDLFSLRYPPSPVLLNFAPCSPGPYYAPESPNIAPIKSLLPINIEHISLKRPRSQSPSLGYIPTAFPPVQHNTAISSSSHPKPFSYDHHHLPPIATSDRRAMKGTGLERVPDISSLLFSPLEPSIFPSRSIQLVSELSQQCATIDPTHPDYPLPPLSPGSGYLSSNYQPGFTIPSAHTSMSFLPFQSNVALPNFSTPMNAQHAPLPVSFPARLSELINISKRIRSDYVQNVTSVIRQNGVNQDQPNTEIFLSGDNDEDKENVAPAVSDEPTEGLALVPPLTTTPQDWKDSDAGSPDEEVQQLVTPPQDEDHGSPTASPKQDVNADDSATSPRDPIA